MIENFYKILGLQRNCTPEEIKASYRKVVRTCHPDKGGDEELFKRYTEAYETLSDPDKRKKYDVSSGMSNIMGRWSGAFGESNVAKDFGVKSSKIEGKKGVNIKASVSCEFLEAVNGCELELPISRWEKCQHCDGVGCLMCNLRGRSRSELTERIQVRSGVLDGEILKYPGLGHASTNGGPNGDLIVKVMVDTDHTGKFGRLGNDVYTNLYLHPSKLILGCDATVDTTNGTIEIRIPEGTSGGTKFRLKNRGVDGGDFFVRVNMMTPNIIGEEDREMWKKLLYSHEEHEKELLRAKFKVEP